jgi:hypothetical protein
MDESSLRSGDSREWAGDSPTSGSRAFCEADKAIAGEKNAGTLDNESVRGFVTCARRCAMSVDYGSLKVLVFKEGARQGRVLTTFSSIRSWSDQSNKPDQRQKKK